VLNYLLHLIVCCPYAFILAAVSRPKFKPSWIDDPAEKARCIHMLESVCESDCQWQQMCSRIQTTHSQRMKIVISSLYYMMNLHHSSTSSSSTGSQCLSYLSDSDRSFDMLSRYPKMKAVFIKYSTPVPSSAPVERLFSVASIILSKHRSRLSDEIFEKLLLLRQNRHLIK